jgi:hypothetical protein
LAPDLNLSQAKQALRSAAKIIFGRRLPVQIFQINCAIIMPHFRLETNVAAEKIPKSFLTDTTALIAKILGKPQSVSLS